MPQDNGSHDVVTFAPKLITTVTHTPRIPSNSAGVVTISLFSTILHVALSVASLSPLPSCARQFPHLLCGKLPCTNLVGHIVCSTTTTPPLTQPAHAAGAGCQPHGCLRTPSARNPCRLMFVCFSLLRSPYVTDPIDHTPSCHPQPPLPHR